MADIEHLAISLDDYLTKHLWLFNYSNVKIMQEKNKWPKEWYDFIHETSVIELKEVFKTEASNSCPTFVKFFVKTRNSLLAKLESILVGVIETPNSKSVIEEKQLWNQLKRGMNLKKQHEVLMFGPIIEQLDQSCEGLDHIVDVGSGAGHLERYLLKMTSVTQDQIVCIESSNSHVESSIKQTRNEEALRVSTINSTVKNDVNCHKDLDSLIEVRDLLFKKVC